MKEKVKELKISDEELKTLIEAKNVIAKIRNITEDFWDDRSAEIFMLPCALNDIYDDLKHFFGEDE